MSGNGDDKPDKPVDIDSWCCVMREPGSIAILNLIPNSVQEALRMYFRQIKNEDLRLLIYNLQRDATEYDAGHVQKHKEDLNTTLV
jgi:hypothetical protein